MLRGTCRCPDKNVRLVGIQLVRVKGARKVKYVEGKACQREREVEGEITKAVPPSNG